MENTKNYWLVGSSIDGKEQLDRFLSQGIWEHATEDKHNYLEQMQVGDAIAIKATYTQKNNLPFNANGLIASAMDIKARGVITSKEVENKRVYVDWEKLEPVKTWYFYTNRMTIWRLNNFKFAQRLKTFVFEDVPQDYQFFQNSPYWVDRYGTKHTWLVFYEELVEKLANYAKNRQPLVELVKSLNQDLKLNLNLDIEYQDGKRPLEDICPFSLLGLITRWFKLDKQLAVAKKFADFFNIQAPLPTSFNGTPWSGIYNNWFFSHFHQHRKDTDIPSLWQLFLSVREYKNEGTEAAEEKFIAAFNSVQTIHSIKWNITNGLFWVAPELLLSIDNSTKQYLNEKLNINFSYRNSPTGESYLELIEEVKNALENNQDTVNSLPDLVAEAYRLYSKEHEQAAANTNNKNNNPVASNSSKPINKILYGPPGTGKTYRLNKLQEKYTASNELAAEQNFKTITFHQSYSYEDFIEGLRPITGEDGQVSYEIEAGSFKQLCQQAKNNPTSRYAVFIDEINRGNISKIFGELITLIETDKRAEYAADGKLIKGMEIELPYSKEKFGVPVNIDIYGTMNTADRSIALLDTALRRRFVFEELMPQVNVIPGIDDTGIISTLEGELDLRLLLTTMNKRIEFLLHRDLTLGHAYLMRVKTLEQLIEVFQQQFIPLLQEYFYNDWQQLQLVFNDLTANRDLQIIQHETVSADRLFSGITDIGIEEKTHYQINPNFGYAAIRKIYSDDVGS